MRKKEKINVLVLVGDTSNGLLTHIRKIEESIDYYGFSWDIFKQIKNMPEIKNKYDFNFINSNFNDMNYDVTINKVNKGLYDLSIGLYIHTNERDNKVLFTKPVLIDDIAVFHFDNNNFYKTSKYVIKKISKLIIILIVLGFLAGFIIYYFDPNRKLMLNKINQKKFLARSLMTGISTFFGEMGYLSENSSPNFKSLAIITVIMLTAFIFIQYMQAKITALVIEKNDNRDLNLKELKEKPLLGHYGYAMAESLEKIGLKIKYQKNKSNKELFKEYENNYDKYNGVVISYADGYSFLKEIPGLVVSTNFGNQINSFIVNKQKKHLLLDLNQAITKLRVSGKLREICKNHYFNRIDGFIETKNNQPICNLL